MALSIIDIDWDQLKDYLEKYGSQIKHIIYYQHICSDVNAGRKVRLVIEE